MATEYIQEELYAIPLTEENLALLKDKWHKVIPGEYDLIFVPESYLPDNEDGVAARLFGKPVKTKYYLMARLLWAAEEQKRSNVVGRGKR